jgi:hypothetical protein
MYTLPDFTYRGYMVSLCSVSLFAIKKFFHKTPAGNDNVSPLFYFSKYNHCGLSLVDNPIYSGRRDWEH